MMPHRSRPAGLTNPATLAAQVYLKRTFSRSAEKRHQIATISNTIFSMDTYQRRCRKKDLPSDTHGTALISLPLLKTQGPVECGQLHEASFKQAVPSSKDKAHENPRR
tara:strand:- start:317 stop:640 length:324 start_codon:yes stop_codon:yes gene_type:complete